MLGIRTVRRLVVVLTGLALVGPLSVVARPDVAAAAPNGFVTMTDGVSIAVNVRMPTNYIPGQRYPTVFEMSGYDGGSANGGTLAKDVGVPPGTPVPRDDSRQLTDLFNGEYVTVHASVRGTGCSSGEFDLFSWRSALDGKEIIDNWIPNQSWSDGAVGIVGHSYGGITGFMVAATQPQHLKAVTVSGLIDDVYRALAYPGGVSNYGFPLLWTGGIRPAYDVAGGLLPGLVRPQRPEDTPNRQERCAVNAAGKSRTVTNDPLLQGLSETDNDWFRSRSLITYVDKIKVPIHMVGAYQDEQTGPRGPAHLYDRIGGVPKRLMLTNGNHDTESTADYGVADIRNDRKAWLDQWVRGVNGGFGTLKQARSSATVLFETHKDESGALVPNGRKDARTFPLPDTRWTDWYVHGDGSLTTDAPTAPEPSQPYVNGTKRQFWSYQAGGGFGPPVTTAAGPDELTYRGDPVASDTAIAGPITATLFMQSTAPDTELFVDVVDEAPDGSRTYLQRGLLRASHRAVDDSQSEHTPDGRIYRPHRPHTNPTPITPSQTYEYLVEVWPVGHVFRAGHSISVKVHAPPFVDSYYAYVPRSAPGVNTVLQGPDTPSRIMLPMVPLTGVQLGPPLPCGAQEAVRCVAQPG
ncbi:MAG: CocE/NonD family hydrolase [Actinomycetota bacterium]|nr:CocE/NonD family hydrolase [Actinomycetota bacterium]